MMSDTLHVEHGMLPGDVKPTRRLYFINEIVEWQLTKYIWTGCTDVKMRDEIMSHATELIRQIIRKQGLHTIYPGQEESAFGDLSQTAWCVSPDTIVITNSGMRGIGDVVAGDTSVYGVGGLHNVSGTVTRKSDDAIRVTTSLGHELIMSGDHKLPVIKSRSVSSVAAKDLRVGNFINAQYGQCCFGNSYTGGINGAYALGNAVRAGNADLCDVRDIMLGACDEVVAFIRGLFGDTISVRIPDNKIMSCVCAILSNCGIVWNISDSVIGISSQYVDEFKKVIYDGIDGIHPFSIWVAIKSIDSFGGTDVVDIEVPAIGMFVANGILSFNCQIERTLYKYRAVPHCRMCYSPDKPSKSVLYKPADREYGIKTLKEVVTICGRRCPYCGSVLSASPIIEPMQGRYGGSESILYRGMSKVFNLWSQISRTVILAYIKKEARDRKNSGSYANHLCNKSQHDNDIISRFVDEAREVCRYHDQYLDILDALEELIRSDPRPYDGIISKLVIASGKPRQTVAGFMNFIKLHSYEFTDSPTNSDGVKINYSYDKHSDGQYHGFDIE